MSLETNGKQQISGSRCVRGRLVVLSDRTSPSWSVWPHTMLQRSRFGSGCIFWLQWVDAMPATPERAGVQPLPTLEEQGAASVLSCRHIGIKWLLYTSALLFSPSSKDTLLNNEFHGCCLLGAWAAEGRLSRLLSTARPDGRRETEL